MISPEQWAWIAAPKRQAQARRVIYSPIKGGFVNQYV